MKNPAAKDVAGRISDGFGNTALAGNGEEKLLAATSCTIDFCVTSKNPPSVTLLIPPCMVIPHCHLAFLFSTGGMAAITVESLPTLEVAGAMATMLPTESASVSSDGFAATTAIESINDPVCVTRLILLSVSVETLS